MYNFNNAQVTLDDFKNHISDEDIYNYYLGSFEDNSWFSSPWRNDTDPSLRISYYNKKWVWTDFGEDPRPKSGIDFIMRYYNISFYDALQKGWADIMQVDEPSLKKKVIKYSSTSYCEIRGMLDFELDYWAQAHITKKDLEYFNVYSGEIRHNRILWHRSIKEDPLFIYMWDKKTPIYKGYRPFAPESKLKFYAKNTSGHIQGLDKIPETGNILIITKSYKDVIVWWKLGYTAIAPHSENMFISPFDLYELESRFDHIYINYDNDETGVKKSIQYSSEHNLKYFNLPVITNCKDPFQFVSCYGYDELNNLFLQKLKRDGIDKE
jgi:hypothetical protein